MRKVIEVGLSTAEINRAIKEVESYKKWVENKSVSLRERVAAEIATEMASNFSAAVSEILIKGESRAADVSVSVESRGDITLVIANGADAIWCEFGTGVYHNGSVGTSPHPRGQELGFTIGTYGKGRGARKVWGFYEDGVLRLTRGVPAQMPMYRAAMSVAEKIDMIAREVFV